MIYDPVGLDRTELLRLAHARLMIQHFDVSKLSPAGFRVLVDQPSATLPGEGDTAPSRWANQTRSRS